MILLVRVHARDSERGIVIGRMTESDKEEDARLQAASAERTAVSPAQGLHLSSLVLQSQEEPLIKVDFAFAGGGGSSGSGGAGGGVGGGAAADAAFDLPAAAAAAAAAVDSSEVAVKLRSGRIASDEAGGALASPAAKSAATGSVQARSASKAARVEAKGS